MGEVVIGADITCPGCHFGCKLVNYQCGRGQEFFELASAGGELPVRRGPVFTPSERAALGEHGKPPLNDRVMHGLNVLAGVMQKRHEEAAERKVVLELERAQGFSSLPILSQRTQTSRGELAVLLGSSPCAELVALERRGPIAEAACLTEQGARKAIEWRCDREERSAEFLEPLSEDEKEQLDALLRKLFMKRRPAKSNES